MTEMSKIPRTNLIRRLDELEPGDSGYVSQSAITVKPDGTAYLHSTALLSPQREYQDNIFVKYDKSRFWELHITGKDHFRVNDKLPGTAVQFKVDTIIV